MRFFRAILSLSPLLLLQFIAGSCSSEFKAGNHTAYFGGEVSNPKSRYVLFCKGSEVLDTLPLNEKNRFFKKFDSLAPGMYSFRHTPEYQYVYFEKNDSLLVSINTRDFDESIVFTGRGEEKNNMLMQLYLNNEHEMSKLFNIFDSDVDEFLKEINMSYKKNLAYYSQKKEAISWSDDFDVYAKATVDFPYYSQKEVYPVLHKIRKGVDVSEKLPKDYYDFRKNIDFNNPHLSYYSPFVRYLSHMLNNVAAQANISKSGTKAEIALETNTLKLNIADTLIANQTTKNTILNNIAFTYLLEDQNMENNQKFLEVYNQYSTDKSKKNEITNISNAIKLLERGKPLPKVELIDRLGRDINSDSLTKRKTVIFFWNSNMAPHHIEAHARAFNYQQKHRDYQFIAVNINRDNEKWLSALKNKNFNKIPQFRAKNFDSMRYQWAINKIHRTIIIDENGNIKDAFTNLFDSDFEELLD
ncbi:MAG: redoxin family protein [Flavobacterium sp.]|nr:redoxin family protein [Flavobacterium sp.]